MVQGQKQGHLGEEEPQEAGCSRAGSRGTARAGGRSLCGLWQEAPHPRPKEAVSGRAARNED
eukprot:scaffold501_cov105-Isochrysis_galbana.AAC.4